jgi:hypothetical protein
LGPPPIAESDGPSAISTVMGPLAFQAVGSEFGVAHNMVGQHPLDGLCRLRVEPDDLTQVGQGDGSLRTDCDPSEISSPGDGVGDR